MHRPGSVIFLVLLVLGGGSAAAADAGSEGPPALEQAIAASKGAGRPLILEFWTTWCKPCKLFEKQILEHPSVVEALRGVELVRYDAESGPGIAAAARYHVNAFPSVIVVDSDGTE